MRLFRQSCFAVMFLLTISLLASSSYADKKSGMHDGVGHGKGQSKSHGTGHGKSKAKNAARVKGKKSSVRFTKTDKSEITKYFNASPFPSSTLPPGIAKNLARGKPLPPGIEKVFLPDGLLSKLPAYPGYEYLAVDEDVLLVNQTTGIVKDIFANALK